MGASEFSIVAWGIDANEAYDQARRQATTEYGTDPYNGTIATTCGVNLVIPPAGWTDAEVEMLGWILDGLEHRIPDALPKPGRLPAGASNAAMKRAAAERRLAKKWASLTFTQRSNLARSAQFEKRGACVAVQVTTTGPGLARMRAAAGLKRSRKLPFRFYGLAAS